MRRARRRSRAPSARETRAPTAIIRPTLIEVGEEQDDRGEARRPRSAADRRARRCRAATRSRRRRWRSARPTPVAVMTRTWRMRRAGRRSAAPAAGRRRRAAAGARLVAPPRLVLADDVAGLGRQAARPCPRLRQRLAARAGAPCSRSAPPMRPPACCSTSRAMSRLRTSSVARRPHPPARRRAPRAPRGRRRMRRFEGLAQLVVDLAVSSSIAWLRS